MGFATRPRSVEELQAASAIGQGTLFGAWEAALASEGQRAGQVLLSLHDIADRGSSVTVSTALKTLLAWGVVPVINENDTTATEEITFGDNDLLAAQVAMLLGADLLVLLTEADGLHESDPRSNPSAPLISEVSDIAQLDGYSISQRANELGSGGMRSKVVAAEMATSAGIETIVGPGLRAGTLLSAASGEAIGTKFHAGQQKLGSFKAWLRFAKPAKGTVRVDAGAAQALAEGGSSLLPVGVIAVDGQFEAGDAIEILLGEDLVGKGLSSYSADELRLVMGKKSSQVRELIPRAADEAVHRDRFASA
jgi:glutamate 5-kinase